MSLLGLIFVMPQKKLEQNKATSESIPATQNQREVFSDFLL